MKVFKAPKESLGDLDADSAATLIATAADVALIIDGQGVIQDSSFQRIDLSAELEGYGRFLGRPWAETVTAESQPKIEAILREAATNAPSRWRQVNHVSSQGGDIPILYSAIQIGAEGRYIALGRDLRAVAALQQRLVEAQMAMERDYSRLRHVETRYRMLFQMSAEPVLIADGVTQKVSEANPVAVALFDGDAKRVIGRALADLFDPQSIHAITTLISDARNARRSDGIKARLAHGGTDYLISASLFRHENNTLLLVRLAAANAGALPAAKANVLAFLEHAPDGLVVTNREGRIASANASFLDMAQLTSTEQARGELLDRWLGRSGVDLGIVLANLRQHGSVRLFATILRGEYGANTDVEVSAVSMPDTEPASYGFAIRNVGHRLSAETKSTRELPRSADQLTELIGRVPLKDIVRETADVIERLCIEAALAMTGDNRASAAEMLGLSRQSLYVKLRRFGLADAAADDEAPDHQDHTVES